VTSVFPFMSGLDVGDPIVLLSGVHGGCYELFGAARVRAIRDLKGKTVGVGALGSGYHFFLASMLAYVGLNPQKDVNWDVHPAAETMQLLAQGKIDALIAVPPHSSELRAKQIGHVVVNTARDRPWSQYFCCLTAANREFVRTHPVATKRALHAILKAMDLCALEPERVARFMVEKGYVERYDYTLETLKDVSYNQWREHDPEDTVRFYALRLYEVGMLKTSPQKLIAQGTDWRFLNELKKELKG
jgi:NitT/TauT family transport system substrate-binding protein